MTALMFYIFQSFSIIGLAGLFLSFWIISNNLIILIKRLKNYSTGMIVSHLGVGILIIGITASSVWQEENVSLMKIENEAKIKKYNIVFKKIEEVKEANYVAIRGNFVVYDNEKLVTKLKPENRYYPVTKNFTSEASIHTNIFRDLYIVMGEGNLKDGWIVRIYYNPLVIWIWIGALIIFLGGLISLNNNIKKIKLLHQ